MSQPLTCSWNECKNSAKSKGFYLKHYTRGILLNNAKEKGVRICDDGKRPCHNETFNFKLKCEKCLRQTRELENMQHKEWKQKGLCTMCGIELKSLTKGIKDLIQKCEKCYSKMRNVEDNRDRVRNYSFEKRLNPSKHYREYADGATRKNVQFELTLEEFSEIVNNPCYYCKKYIYNNHFKYIYR